MWLWSPLPPPSKSTQETPIRSLMVPRSRFSKRMFSKLAEMPRRSSMVTSPQMPKNGCKNKTSTKKSSWVSPRRPWTTLLPEVKQPTMAVSLGASKISSQMLLMMSKTALNPMDTTVEKPTKWCFLEQSLWTSMTANGPTNPLQTVTWGWNMSLTTRDQQPMPQKILPESTLCHHGNKSLSTKDWSQTTSRFTRDLLTMLILRTRKYQEDLLLNPRTTTWWLSLRSKEDQCTPTSSWSTSRSFQLMSPCRKLSGPTKHTNYLAAASKSTIASWLPERSSEPTNSRSGPLTISTSKRFPSIQILTGATNLSRLEEGVKKVKWTTTTFWLEKLTSAATCSSNWLTMLNSAMFAITESTY